MYYLMPDVTLEQVERYSSLTKRRKPDLVVPSILMDVCRGAAQVPQLHDGIVVVFVRTHNLGGHCWVPG